LAAVHKFLNSDWPPFMKLHIVAVFATLDYTNKGLPLLLHLQPFLTWATTKA
jgi:hypothetical protein